MLTKTSESIELFLLSADDYESLARYLMTFPDETGDLDFWRDRFRLWWEDNPAFSNGLARGWVLKNNDKIVGFMGNLSTSFLLAGKPIIVNSGTTWRVDSNYRTQSLRLFFELLKYSKETLLFGTTPNDTVSRVLEMSKFQLLPRGGRRTSVLITNFEKALGALLPKNGGGRLMVKALAPIFDLIQQWRLTPADEKERLSVREVFKADPSFDELWEKTKNRYPYTSIRSAKIIHWYCFGSQRFRKKLFGVYKDGLLWGYAIFANPQGRRLNFLECLDFWCEPGEKNAVGLLIDYLRKYAQKNSFDGVKFYGFSTEMDDLFKTAGLFQIRAKRSREYVRVKMKLEPPLSRENAYFSYMLGDIGL